MKKITFRNLRTEKQRRKENEISNNTFTDLQNLLHTELIESSTINYKNIQNIDQTFKKRTTYESRKSERNMSRFFKK